MYVRFLVTLLVLTASSGAHAQDAAPAKPAKSWGGALQVDIASGGEQASHVVDTDGKVSLGQGLTLSGGFFFRPVEHSNFEMQLLAGFKGGAPYLITVGPYTDVTRWVFQVLADYRNNDRWYYGGGLVLHGNPKITGDLYGFYGPEDDLHFDDALGAVVEAGWNWVGVQCTWMQYHASGHGTFDASNCGVRFTLHFRKWHPAN
jgi:hypothetical protein